MILKDVEAYLTIFVDVRMVYLSDELKIWGLKGIILREIDFQFEYTFSERRIVWSNDSGRPIVLI